MIVPDRLEVALGLAPTRLMSGTMVRSGAAMNALDEWKFNKDAILYVPRNLVGEVLIGWSKPDGSLPSAIEATSLWIWNLGAGDAWEMPEIPDMNYQHCWVAVGNVIDAGKKIAVVNYVWGTDVAAI
jgi:hypothetical protein